MKRIIYLIAAISLVLSSCTIETSDNGDFDGFWHLERVDTLATGNYLDLSKERVFWGVQHRKCRMGSYPGFIKSHRNC